MHSLIPLIPLLFNSIKGINRINKVKDIKGIIYVPLPLLASPRPNNPYL